MLIKFSSTSNWDLDEAPISLVVDRKGFEKQAFVKHALKYEKTTNQVDVHVIALGAWEAYGPNRNGDAFPVEDCIKCAHTFKRANRAIHYNHKNKPHDPKYGNIKASAYNPEMQRIELIIGLDKDNPRNQNVLQKIASGDQFCVSMACKIPGDYCTWCDHFAPDENSRCEHIPHRLLEMNSDGVKCAMVNKNPNWFEQSIVERPADYIGYSLNSNTKIASDRRTGPLTTNDYLAFYTGFDPQETNMLILSKHASAKRLLLRKLAEMEKQVQAIAKSDKPKHDFLKRQADALNETPDMDDKDIDELRKHEPGKAFKAMADSGVMLSPLSFLKYVLSDKADNESLAKGMKSKLPNVYSKMEDDGDDKDMHDEKFEPDESGSLLPKELKGLIERLSKSQSMFGEPSVKRVMQITIAMGGSKKDHEAKESKKHEAQETKAQEAQEDKQASECNYELAKVYANYKLATLRYLESQNKLDELCMFNALIQNRR